MDLVLKLDRVPDSGLDLVEALSFSEVRELVPEYWTGFEAPLDVTLRVERHGEAYSVLGRIRGRVTGLCARCAADVAVPLDEHVAALFTAEEATDVKLGDGVSGAAVGGHEWYPVEGDALHLADPFRDALAFALPDYPRCPEGQCDPGVERYLVRDDEARRDDVVDPRLAKLVELSERMKDS